MEESRLTPFDAETILMIKSITGHEPEITEKAELFEMKMYVDDKDEYIVKAAIDAVIGRYGMRVRAVEHIWEQIFLRGATFLVEYEKGAENMPYEIRADLKEPNDMAKTIKEIKDEIQKSLINFANEHGIESMDLQVNIKTKEETIAINIALKEKTRKEGGNETR